MVNYDLFPILRLLSSLLSPIALVLILLYDLRASCKACLVALELISGNQSPPLLVLLYPPQLHSELRSLGVKSETPSELICPSDHEFVICSLLGRGIHQMMGEIKAVASLVVES